MFYVEDSAIEEQPKMRCNWAAKREVVSYMVLRWDTLRADKRNADAVDLTHVTS